MFTYCYIHNKREFILLAFHVCFECKHVYKTARGLVRAYNNVRRAALIEPYTLARTVKEVYYCPFCLHDF